MTMINENATENQQVQEEATVRESRLPRLALHHVLAGVKVRTIAFGAGLTCGVLLMVIRPWEQMLAGNGNTMPAVAAEGETVLAVDTGDRHEKANVTISYLQEITNDASDLVTTRYHYQNANTYTNTKQLWNINLPLTTTEYVYTYEGTVCLGIDVSEIGFSVDNAHQEIEVCLPDVEIVANEIDADSFVYYTSKTTIFNMTEMGDITALIDVLQQDEADRVMADKALLGEAETRAEDVVESLILRSDLAAEYTVVFR